MVVMVVGHDVEIDEDRFEVRRGGTGVRLEPQAFDVLLYLVRHRDRVVPKEELMDAVWGGRFVSETAVTSRIKQIRKALGDDGRTQGAVRTVHRRGYQFVAPVADAPAPSAPPAPTAPSAAPAPSAPSLSRQPGLLRSQIRYTTSDGLHIAYQVTGSGPIDIVLVSGFVSHLEIDWDEPHHAHFLERLGRMGRLIRFDKRGTGMSDRPEGVPDLETRMHDVRAVMAATGSRRAVLVGYSEGGPMSMLMATRHPELVSGLVLFGSYACRVRDDDYPWAWTAEQRTAFTDWLVTSWDWEEDCRLRCPSGDAEMQAWWARRMRASATPATIRALMQMNGLVDVRSVLPSISAPTLVLQRRDDRVVMSGQAAYIADRIPGARLVMLEGEDHVPWGDPDQVLDVIEPFIRELSQRPA